jgi:hypothetical protein
MCFTSVKGLPQRTDRTLSPAHADNPGIFYLTAPQNTMVLVAADGFVTFVHDDCNTGGTDPSYWNYTSFIATMHSN